MWEQYLVLLPDGFQSSQFRHYYKIWGKRVNPVMHMNHKSGDKMYVDYAGKTLSIIDKESASLKDEKPTISQKDYFDTSRELPEVSPNMNCLIWLAKIYYGLYKSGGIVI